METQSFEFNIVEQKEERLEVNRLSSSMLDKFRYCGELFNLKYRKGVGAPKSFYMIAGTVIHRAIELWLIKGQQEADACWQEALKDKLDEQAYELYLSYLRGEITLSKVESSKDDTGYYFPFRCTFGKKLDEMHTDFIKFTEEPHNIITLCLIHPFQTELQFESNVKGIPFVGVIDLIVKEGDIVHLVDFKSGRAYAQEKVDLSLQLIAYAHRVHQKTGMPLANIKAYIYTTKENKLVERKPFTQGELDNFENICYNIKKAIDNDIYIPVQGMTYGREDNCKVCEYKSSCKYHTVLFEE